MSINTIISLSDIPFIAIIIIGIALSSYIILRLSSSTMRRRVFILIVFTIIAMLATTMSYLINHTDPGANFIRAFLYQWICVYLLHALPIVRPDTVSRKETLPMEAEVPNALWMPNNNCFVGRNGYHPNTIIIHGTAGGSSAQGVASFFQSTQGGDNPVSAHLIIDGDGIIVQCNHLGDGAWANGVFSAGHDSFWNTSINPNLITISIECVKSATDNSSALSAKQFQALVSTVEWICDHYGIPKRWADATGGITGHFSIDPVNRSRCPGPFDWAKFFTQLQTSGGNDMLQLTDPMGTFFRDIGNGQWKCTNGHIIGGDILKFYRASNGVLRLPLSDEIPGVSPGTSDTVQLFEGGVVAYDPKGTMDNPPRVPGAETCYVMHYDAWIARTTTRMAPQSDVDAALAHVNDLQSQLTAQHAQVTDLQTQMTQLQQQLTQTQATATGLTAQQQDDLKTKIATLMADVQALQTAFVK